MFKSDDTMEKISKEKGFAGWFATSAKDNLNIEESAQYLVNKIIDNDKWSNHKLNGRDQTDTIDLMQYRNPNLGLNSSKKCNC